MPDYSEIEKRLQDKEAEYKVSQSIFSKKDRSSDSAGEISSSRTSSQSRLTGSKILRRTGKDGPSTTTSSIDSATGIREDYVPDYMPPRPKNLDETGISPKILESLILKFIAKEGSLSNTDLAYRIKLSANMVSKFTGPLSKRKFLDTWNPPNYNLTVEGKELAERMIAEDSYLGPAPVNFQSYCDMVNLQAEYKRWVNKDEVRGVFKGYSMPEDLLTVVKEGFNSQRVILLYGPPGNGKSLVTTSMHKLLLDRPVILPYAFEFNGKCIRIFDRAYHTPWDPDFDPDADDMPFHNYDDRWVICKPPMVIVGTEFKVEHFDIAFDGGYNAPPNVKANNGFFIFDDLGRQTQDHNMILNQFIYPLESQEMIVKMFGGSSMRVPFKQRLFLSTNLNKDKIIDDAFKRRLLYQIPVLAPDDAGFDKIIRLEAGKAGLEDSALVDRISSALLEWYNTPPEENEEWAKRACDPRNIFVMLASALEKGETLPDRLDRDWDMLRNIWERYPKSLVSEIPEY
jgi:predicted transcriptional regulator